MSFLRRKPAEVPVAPPAEPPTPVAGKGRPTPKRREAVKRTKTTGKALTKDERRVQAAERREKMMRGDDAHVLPRDRGQVRAYVRDLVDARRSIAGLLLPIALLSFVILLIPNVPVLQVYGPLVLLVGIVAAVIDSMIFSRQLKRKITAKFPKGDGSGLSTKGGALGFYAFNRACLPRRWRVPRPRFPRGTAPS